MRRKITKINNVILVRIKIYEQNLKQCKSLIKQACFVKKTSQHIFFFKKKNKKLYFQFFYNIFVALKILT